MGRRVEWELYEALYSGSVGGYINMDKDSNIKQDLLDLCDDMSMFFLQLKAEMELVSEVDAELVNKFETYFQEHKDIVSKFSDVKNKIRGLN